MKYLITGGAGFVGSHLAEALVNAGHEVVVYDDLSTGHEENLAGFRDRVEFVRADIGDRDRLAAAMAGAAGVFHEAALVSVADSVERPLDNHRINITGTLGVLLAARDAGVPRLVFAASAAAYGNNPDLPKRETMRPEPASPYGLAKVAGEYYLRTFAELYGLETVALRYFNVYGPRQDPRSMYSGVISKFTDLLIKDQTPTIYGDGRQTRDFVYVGDIVRANLLAMTGDRVGRGEVINIGTGVAVSLLDLLEVFGELTGWRPAPRFAPARAGDVRDSLADITLARDLLGYAPATDIRTGLRRLLDSLAP